MSTFKTVFLKELRDILRDRRTLHMMIVVPLVFYPAVSFILGTLQDREARNLSTRVIQVAVTPPHEGEPLREFLSTRASLVEPWKAEVEVVLSSGFDEQTVGTGTGYASVHSQDEIAAARVNGWLNEFRQSLLAGRQARLEQSPSFFRPLVIQSSRQGSREGPGLNIKTALYAGMCTYFLVFLTFTGSMPPAIDLGAGEKERGTLETLLTSPASRSQILAGKLAVVSLSGLSSAVMSCLGLIPVNLLSHGGARQLTREALQTLGTLENFVFIAALLVLLSIFFSSLLLSISLLSRSPREAHHRIMPVMMLVTVLLLAGILPSVPFNTWTALVPVLNAVLCLRTGLAGHAQLIPLALTCASLLLSSFLTIRLAARAINRESVFFKP